MHSDCSGVSGSQSGPCPNGFHPTFPSASPYVTAVGATDVPSAEKAASFSGGGFSNYWARPSYQVNAVSQYFKVAQNLPSSSLYNATGAGFPDVAAIGTNFAIYCTRARVPALRRRALCVSRSVSS
ncbi:hypothetical protein EON67_03455 [archaeon]|nr:MAG: hypothetical protein EON67_03455 [archaeon]